MALVSYREIKDRFTHIDATLVGIHYSWPGEDATYTVQFRTWWEHEQARDLTVTVHARRVREICLSPTSEVVDWDFLEEHPLLWPYHDAGQVFLNTPLSQDQSTGLLDLVIAEGSTLQYLNLSRGIQAFRNWMAEGHGASIGMLPKPLYELVTHYLEKVGAEYSIMHIPEQRAEIPKLLLIDGSDYIVADDFEVDVSE